MRGARAHAAVWCVALVVSLVALSPAPALGSASPAAGCPSDTAIAGALGILASERTRGAREAIEPYEQSCLGSAPFLFALGQVRFLEGAYDAALEAFAQALLLDPPGHIAGALRHFQALASRTRAFTANYLRYDDPAGHFSVRYAPGKDAVLLPYLKAAFPLMRARIGEALGYVPDHPVRIEIFEEPGDLARASSLTEDEIETSGTIALCKYRKLMLVSPKALVRGYGWLDTLSHEYVHYVIQRQTGSAVPIWLHEAYAKYLESRWRSDPSEPMRPSSQHLLRKAIRKNDLVSFEEMSPSMAKLPSRERTALAFAEVYAVARFLEERVGLEGMRRLLGLMDEGRSDREALEEVLGMSFQRFYKTWRRYVRRQKWRSVPAGVLELLVFRDRDDPREELHRIGEKAAEDFTYLGDLLKARGRHKAAVVEYRKAEARTKAVNPFVQSKLADGLLRIDQPAAALEAVQGPLPHYPEHVLLQLARGKAAARTGDDRQAFEALELALRLNPFDVEIHDLLATVAERLGEAAVAERERAAAQLLRAAGESER